MLSELRTPEELVARRALGATPDMLLKAIVAEDLLAFRALLCGPRLIRVTVMSLAARRRSGRCMDAGSLHIKVRRRGRGTAFESDRIVSKAK